MDVVAILNMMNLNEITIYVSCNSKEVSDINIYWRYFYSNVWINV